MYPVAEIVEHARAVPPPPRALSRLMETISKPEHDMHEVAEVLNTDTMLTARLLETANSAYYGVPGGVASVSRALMVLGEREVLRIAVAECARVLRDKDLDGYCLDGQSLWTKSLYTAIFAEALAEQSRQASPQIAYTAGLLLDIGKLGLDHFVGLEIAALGDTDAASSGADFDALERTCLGTDHAQLGAKMAESWGLPEPLCSAIAHHHIPIEGEPLTRIAHCADALALSLVGGGIDGMRYTVSDRCMNDLGVEEDEVDLMILQTTLRVAELQEQQ